MLEDFGPYRIVRKIAVGGMAEIYLARHRGLEGLERTVVLKRILPSYSNNPEFVTMFLDEARLMAGLSHPNIAQVLDLGTVGDGHYLVMEHVRGPTLRGLLSAAEETQTRVVPEPAALAVALNVAQALHYVHGLHDEVGRPLNIVHRDLNPANVLVAYTGAVKLIDFGIAKAATKVYETRTGVIKGTYGYIAPEQLTSRDAVDHRADVFALGVLMYEMCVGVHPFDTSDEPDRIERVLEARYKRPREIRPDFPVDLDRLIASCLAAAPENRPASVGIVIEEMVDYMAARGVIPTMGTIAAAAAQLVPDLDGPAPLRPLRASQLRGSEPAEPSQTAVIRTLLEGHENEGGGDAPFFPADEATIRVPGSEEPGPPVSAPAPPAALPRPTPPPPAAGARPGDRGGQMAHDGDTWNLAARGPTPANVARRRRRVYRAARRAAFFVGSTLLVGGLGVGAFLMARAIGSAGETPSVAAVPPKAASEASEQPPEYRHLRVVSEPDGAAVFVDGRDVALSTPTTVAVPSDKDRVWVRVSLRGHVTQEREVHTTAGEARFVLAGLTVDAGTAGTPPPAAKTRRKRRRARARSRTRAGKRR